MRYSVKRKKPVENHTSKYFFKHLAVLLLIILICALGLVELVSRVNFETKLESGAGTYQVLKTEDVTVPNSTEKWLSVYAISDSDNLDATARKIARKNFKRFLWRDKVYSKISIFIWAPGNIDTHYIANYVYIWDK